MSEYYVSTGAPGQNAKLLSAALRTQFTALSAGFDKMPTLAANGSKLVAVNAGATALESVPITYTASAITIGTDLVSDTDSTDDLGTTGVRWANLWVDDITATTGITAGGDITGLTLAATGDTAAGDAASLGYTATEGLILTGQGSTNDVTIKNDADTTVLSIATGTTTVAMAGAVTVAGAATVTGNTTLDGGLTITSDVNITEAVNGDTIVTVTNSNTGASARAGYVLVSDSSSLSMYATSAAYTGVAGWADSAVITTSSSTSGGLILNDQPGTGGVKIQVSTNNELTIDTAYVNVPSNHLSVTSGSFVVGSATVISTYDAAVVGAGAVDVLIGSTDGSGVTLSLDGNSNGDGAGADYAFIQHDSTGLEFNVPATQTLKLQVAGTSEMTMDATTTTIATNDLVVTAGDVIAGGDITGLTFAATGDTAAGDNASMGYTAAEGLILTGQGSTSDVTIKNDADTTVLSITTGTTTVAMAGAVTVAGVATLASLVATTADINGGTVDGTVIGGTTAAAISGTTGQFGTSLNVDGTATIAGTLGVTGAVTATGNLNVDTVNEITAAGGVTIDSVVVKDGGLTATADVTGLTFAATGDTAAGDGASMGYTAADGLVLTGQGSTSDITIKNDADTTILSVATGTTTAAFSGVVSVGSNLLVPTASFVVGSATVVSGYDAAVVGAGSTDVLIGSTDGNGVTLVLDGNSNGDGSGGDYAYIQHISTGLVFNVPGTETLKLQVGGTSVLSITNAGEVTKPYQPAFYATPFSAQTGLLANDSAVTVAMGTEIFDVGSNFASSTFTAPVTGKYQLNLSLWMTNADTDASYINIGIITSNRNYVNIVDPKYASDPAHLTQNISTLADMDAGDIAYVFYQQSGGAAQTTIKNDTRGSFFQGYLVA